MHDMKCFVRASTSLRSSVPRGLLFTTRGLTSISHCFYYNDTFEVELPQNHRFPMKKYRMVRERVQNECKGRDDVAFLLSPLATREELVTTHCPRYVESYMQGKMTEKEIKRTGFPWSQANVLRSLSSVGGTVAAMRSLFDDKGLFRSNMIFSGHFAGGTHHSFYDYGEGFCIFNDIAVSANIALREYSSVVARILVVDLDTHQGNGTADLFRFNKNVFTFSMHCKQNYFSKKRNSDLDLELPEATKDKEYLEMLNRWLPALLDDFQPDLIFYQAGVDIVSFDRLGRLQVSRGGASARNHCVFKNVASRGIRCVVTMGGGYPKNLDPASNDFEQIVECHADVYRDCISYQVS